MPRGDGLVGGPAARTQGAKERHLESKGLAFECKPQELRLPLHHQNVEACVLLVN